MQTLPLTVLMQEGPMARAYLARLRADGWRVRRTILMVGSRHPVTKKKIAPWLPGPLRRWVGQIVQDLAHLYWPRTLRRSHRTLYARMMRELSGAFPHAERVISQMLGRFNLLDHAERVERIVTDGLSDPAVRRALETDAPPIVLYTGGGLVPPVLLEMPHTRFLHVHPAKLPDIRGADGLLWSMLLRGRPSASVFLMAPQIDTGDLIATMDFDPVRFALDRNDPVSDELLYRALFSYYDPILRAETLARVVQSCRGELNTLAAQPQDRSCGRTYHFMHERIRRYALDRLFADPPFANAAFKETT